MVHISHKTYWQNAWRNVRSFPCTIGFFLSLSPFSKCDTQQPQLFFFATNAHIMRNATAYMLSTCRMSELVLFAHQQIIVRLNMQNDARGLFFALVQLSRLRPQITHTLNYDLFDCWSYCVITAFLKQIFFLLLVCLPYNFAVFLLDSDTLVVSNAFDQYLAFCMSRTGKSRVGREALN